MKIEIAKELRKSAGIVASVKSGQEIRDAISNSLEALATLIEEEEIPIKRMVLSYYLRGVLTGIGIVLIALVLLML